MVKKFKVKSLSLVLLGLMLLITTLLIFPSNKVKAAQVYSITPSNGYSISK